MTQEASTPTRQDRGYSTSFIVDQSPEEVFESIVHVGAWWTGQIEGCADQLGGEFAYRHPPQHYSVQRVVELEPGRRVVWEVVDSHLDFTNEPAEWTGTRIEFDIVPLAAGTELRFTHMGLVPEVECFGACSNAWQFLIGGSLRNLITTGAGLPDPW